MASIIPMPARPAWPLHDGASVVIAQAEAEIYEAAVDLELEIREARTVSEALRLFHVMKGVVELLDKLQVLALERADQLCGRVS